MQRGLQGEPNACHQGFPGERQDKSPQSECGPHTQRQDNERVLGIVPCLKRAIPLIKQIDEGTQNTDRQRHRAGDL